MSRILAAHGAPSRIALLTRLAAELGDDSAAREALEELTPRQRATVVEAARGATNAEIAARLGITVRTVEKHLTDASRRWGAAGRLDLIAIATGLDDTPALAPSAAARAVGT